MWKITFTYKARKDFLSLEKSIQNRIVKKFESAKSNTATAFGSLTNSEYFKLRIGDYRALAILVHEKNEIMVHRIGHRKNIYDRI